MVVMTLPPQWKVTLRQYRSHRDPINQTLEVTVVVRADDGIAAGTLALDLMAKPPEEWKSGGSFDPNWKLCRLEEVEEKD